MASEWRDYETDWFYMYTLEKKIWTQDDFEIMNWHDNALYGFLIEEGAEPWDTSLLLDIDYLFQWVQPVPPNIYFTYWASPCTLIFKNIYDLVIDMDTRGGMPSLLQIMGIKLVSKIEESVSLFAYEWFIELLTGSIQLKSSGFEQHVRKPPMHVQSHNIDLKQRGGNSFSKIYEG